MTINSFTRHVLIKPLLRGVYHGIAEATGIYDLSQWQTKITQFTQSMLTELDQITQDIQQDHENSV